MPESANIPDTFPPEQFDLFAFCDGCGRSVPIERARIPPDLTVPELPDRLRCTACGSWACSMRIVATEAVEFRYRSAGHALADRTHRAETGAPFQQPQARRAAGHSGTLRAGFQGHLCTTEA